jgi:5-methylcytosine-specific restriction endonuclease McrA
LSIFHKSDKARKEKISIAFRASNHPNWQGGSHYGKTRGPGWTRIAERCRELHNRTCKHCGMTEKESKAKGWWRLQVNHIIPFHQWRNKEAANKQSNLEALCKSCHTKADWKWRKENAVQMTLAIFR